MGRKAAAGRNSSEKSKSVKSKPTRRANETLVRRAAKLRAHGHPWEVIAKEVGRSLATVQTYTAIDYWPALLRDECRKVEELLDIELSTIAIQKLRENIESDDGMTSNIALQTFYRNRNANRKMAFDFEKAKVEFEIKRLEIDAKLRSADDGDPNAIDTTAMPVVLEIAPPPHPSLHMDPLYEPALSDHDD